MRKRKSIKSLRRRMILSFLVVGTIPVLLGLSLVYFIGKGSIEKTIGANFQELAYETSQRADSFINQHLRESQFLASTTQTLSLLKERNKSYIGKGPSEIQKMIEIARSRSGDDQASNPYFLSILNNEVSNFIRRVEGEQREEDVHYLILVTDNRGVVVSATSRPEKFYYGGEEWWKITRDGQSYVGDIKFNEAIKDYSFETAIPVVDEGEAIGVLLMSHKVDSFFKAVTSVKVGATDHTMLASSDGALLFCPIFSIKTHHLKEELMKAVFKTTPGWTATKSDVHYFGRRSINGYAPVQLSLSMGSHSFGGNTWYIFTSQDPSETYAPINTLLKWIAASGLLGIGLICLLGMYASRKIVGPIKMLHEGTELIGRGDLSYRLKINSGDEIEELADKFNEMTEKLRASYASLEQKVEERTQELLEANKDLSILYDMTATMSRSLNMDEILSEILKKILSAMGGGAGLIYLLDEELEELFMASSEGLTIRFSEKNTRIKIDTYPYNQVINDGKPYISESLSTTKKWKKNGHFARKFRSLACIPLRSKNKVLGALTIYSTESTAFSKVANLLESIGSQLGISIENARLFSETEEFSRLKSEFVSHVSHELRTPLSSIKSAAEILLNYGEDDKETRKEFLTVVNAEADRLTRLINDILDLSKIESGGVKWHFEPLEFKDILSSSVKVIRVIGKLKKIPIKTSIPKNLPMIMGDRDRLLAVMTNLLDNALKFTQKGVLTVDAKHVDNMVRVSVTDAGKGIPSGDREKIFEPFFQSSDTLEGKPRGTGLGLAICRRIIEKHMGKIWVESEVGEGSTFFFTLPVASSSQFSLNLQVQSGT